MKWVVEGAAVHEYQQFVAETIVESPDTDGPGVSVDSGDLDAGRQPQYICNGSGSRLFDVLVTYDEHRCRCLRQWLRPSARSDDIKLHQLLKGQIGKVQGRTLGKGVAGQSGDKKEEN